MSPQTSSRRAACGVLVGLPLTRLTTLATTGAVLLLAASGLGKQRRAR